MKYLVVALVVALVLVPATFGVQNSTPVTVHFLQFESGNVPLALVMFGSALIGMLLLRVVELPGRVRQRRDTRQLWNHLTAAAPPAVLHAPMLPPVMHSSTKA